MKSHLLFFNMFAMFLRVIISSLVILSACSVTETVHAKNTATDNASGTSDKYSITSQVAPAPFPVGTKGNFLLTITPAKGLTLKGVTPFKASLTGNGLVFKQALFTGKDITPQTTPAKSLQTTFTGALVGSHTITTELSFFLCTAEICQRYKTTHVSPFTVVAK